MEDYHKPDQQTVQALRNIANRLRINCIKATTATGSGHPTSCCSVAEIMSVLFFNTMKYRPEDPKNINNDRFILSKGHAAPALYSMWTETGFLKESELLSLCQVESNLEGHPTPKQQFVDVATGSLGQGLGVACGMAYTGKYFDKSSYRVFCLMGDGELSEGAVWEAMSFASYYQLDNLVAILDINRLGQTDPAPLQHHVEKYHKRCEAFGWHAIIVDGHSVEELCKALSQARHQPTAIIAKTTKGKGIPAAEDKMGWHAKPLPKDMAEGVVKDLQARIMNSSKRLYPATPMEDAPPVSLRNIRMPSAPAYKQGEKVTHTVVAKSFENDTNINFHKVCCFSVSVATGCAARERNVVYASTLASFFTRAYDQLRMAAISESNINLCGSHCGLSIGESVCQPFIHPKHPHYMLLTQPPTITPMNCNLQPTTSQPHPFPSDLTHSGVCYIRTSRPENPIIYSSNEDFHVGQAKVVYQSTEDKVTVIGAGITLHEAMAAAEMLKKERIFIRVIDPFTIKPLDSKTILEHARQTRGRILTVEDHYYEGGLGEAVCSAVVNEQGFTLQRLAVAHVPRSGKPSELLKIYGIDREAICQSTPCLLK
uniref:Transketolase n=1 Tax=Hucho hucho TaxID=62062 RepID=A0A4W5QX77_9TELE